MTYLGILGNIFREIGEGGGGRSTSVIFKFMKIILILMNNDELSSYKCVKFNSEFLKIHGILIFHKNLFKSIPVIEFIPVPKI